MCMCKELNSNIEDSGEFMERIGLVEKVGKSPGRTINVRTDSSYMYRVHTVRTSTK